jgi:hypothetical protein
MMENRCISLKGASVLLLSILTGCASITTPVPPCCYRGSVTTARLAAVPVQLEDGRQRAMAEVLPGFRPGEGLFLRGLPVSEMGGHEVIYASLTPLLPLYDANRDGRLDEPEILVLYLREALLATGVPVRHLGAAPGVWALSTANADVHGLVRWVEANLHRMTPQGRQVMRDLDALGNDQRTRGSENGEPFDDVYIP